MGVPLTPIIKRKVISLSDLRGRTLAVDANNVLYQFLALIRKPDGSPLTDSEGRVTSHLVGLLFRTTRLMSEYGTRLAFVFDGKPPRLKRAELGKRREVRAKALAQWKEAKASGDYATAFSKAVASSKLSLQMSEDAKRLLSLLGVPQIQAPSDAEAQAALMVARGDAWAVASQDYDSLLYGAPRLVRHVTLTGREFLPSKGESRRLLPELIDLQSVLDGLNLSRESLVDLALLVGTDFNDGVLGVGPKTALKFMRQYGSIEAIPSNVLPRPPGDLDSLRKAFLDPEVVRDYRLEFGDMDEEGVVSFLCKERDFSPQRVDEAVKRLKSVRARRSALTKWMDSSGQKPRPFR